MRSENIGIRMKVMMNRRSLLKIFPFLAGILFHPRSLKAQSITSEGKILWSHAEPEWKNISKGLDFARVDVFRGKVLSDSLAVLRIQPKHNKIRVFHSFDHEKTVVRTMEEWQKEISATALINGAQYMADPYYMPCALVICDGKEKGPTRNKNVRGMFVSEPKHSDLPQADLLDSDYDRLDTVTAAYMQAVQHWPILLDRNGKIRVKNTELKANRTVIAKSFKGEILFFTTERASFSLYNFGAFLKDTNAAPSGGFNIHTAMNLDGGREANMLVKSDPLSYLSPGSKLETKGAERGIFDFVVRLPGVIGVFPR